MNLQNFKIKIIRDDGMTFLADGTGSTGTDWGITSISGLDIPSIDTFAEDKAVGDGTIVTGTHVTAREIEFEAVAKNSNLNGILRRFANSFFNAKHTFDLYITYLGVERWISARVADATVPSENTTAQTTATVLFYCADPYFKSVDAFGKNLASTEPMWTFEEIDDPDFGEPFDAFSFAKSVLLYNDGDVECFCTLVIEATNTVKNPKIMHGDAYVRMIDTLQAGDVVEIDLVHKRVRKNGMNCLSKVDKTSNFNGMAFTTGENTISFTADDGENVMKVYLYYNTLYLGV